MNFYGFPEDSETLPGAVKVAMHIVRESPDATRKIVLTPEQIQRKVDEDEVQEMLQLLKKHIPDLTGDLVHTETCMYTMTPDEHL